MFARARRVVGRFLGGLIYWLGWGLAAIVLVQAVIISVTTGSPLIPVMLGVIGVVVWVIGLGLKYLLIGRHSPP